ncbi:MAG: DNA recombination protein RmuC [Candidatus Uhrbacteria bacterium]|nr:DNA recombination protein RmuC [Candidatus Uhrbacteria bacterium]
MDFLDYLLLGLFVLLIAYLIYREKGRTDPQASQNISENIDRMREEVIRSASDHRKEVQQQLDRLQDQMSKGMNQSHATIQRQFDQTSKIIQDVTGRLTELDKTNKQVLDFSGQLQNLQNILKNPKQRGVLGEYWLETLLGNVLPKDSYIMQHTLGIDEATGKSLIADAVIFVRNQKIPIDAKFSLENYNRMMEENDAERRDKIEKAFKADVKIRIDEAAKYIRPEFDTMGFSFMFIPAEGVYYNLLNAEVGSGINSQNLVEYAFNQHVMLVSPTSFYAYLQTVLLGLRELQLEESTQGIIKQVGELGKHFRSYVDYHDKLGKNLSTVVNQYNQSGDELRKVSKDIIKISSGSKEDIIEIDEIHKPAIE